MNERLEILSMIKEGRITPEEGVRLLEAIDRADNADRTGKASERSTAHWLVVEVLSRHGEKMKSLPPIRIPISLVRLFFRFIPKDYLLPGSNATSPEEFLETLEKRKPLELNSEKDGWSIRISAE
jgi:hypothetical protein